MGRAFFKSSLVESSDYLLQCYRYIELNPVRAGMVQNPADYPWSSYRCNGMGKESKLITPHELYLRLGKTIEVRLDNYRSLFQCQIGSMIFPRISGHQVKNDNLNSRRCSNGKETK